MQQLITSLTLHLTSPSLFYKRDGHPNLSKVVVWDTPPAVLLVCWLPPCSQYPLPRQLVSRWIGLLNGEQYELGCSDTRIQRYEDPLTWLQGFPNWGPLLTPHHSSSFFFVVVVVVLLASEAEGAWPSNINIKISSAVRDPGLGRQGFETWETYGREAFVQIHLR